jgi:chloramphenicol-sensitive protein RarD
MPLSARSEQTHGLLFAQGARRLKLATLGLVQYVSPTLQLILGVFLYREDFDSTRAIGFGFIRVGLAIYAFSSARLLLHARWVRSL